MLRWARGKNEDIWREANVEPMTTFVRKRRLRWYGHVLRKEGRGGYRQEDDKYAGAGKEKKGRPKKRGWTTSGMTWKSTR